MSLLELWKLQLRQRKRWEREEARLKVSRAKQVDPAPDVKQSPDVSKLKTTN